MPLLHLQQEGLQIPFHIGSMFKAPVHHVIIDLFAGSALYRPIATPKVDALLLEAQAGSSKQTNLRFHAWTLCPGTKGFSDLHQGFLLVTITLVHMCCKPAAEGASAAALQRLRHPQLESHGTEFQN